jgi:hypothetical protein
MKIPQNVSIPDDKFTQYLLVKREFDDKSKFLLSAGFTLENYYFLIRELKQLIGREEAVKERENSYGVFYSVIGTLTGPQGKKLPVITIWLHKKVDGEFKFITLKPFKGKLI